MAGTFSITQNGHTQKVPVIKSFDHSGRRWIIHPVEKGYGCSDFLTGQNLLSPFSSIAKLEIHARRMLDQYPYDFTHYRIIN